MANVHPWPICHWCAPNILWAAWGLLGFLQIASSRYLKVYWKCSMLLHRISGVFIVVMTIALSIVAFKAASWQLQSGIHVVLGAIALFVCGLLAIGGFVARWAMESVKWNTQRMLWIRFAHRALGYIVLAVAQAAILTGGIRYSDRFGTDTAKVLCAINLVAFIILFVVCEIVLQIYRRKETAFDEALTKISRQEFDQRVSQGEELVLLDDLVLDVGGFKSEHPGGQFLLEHHLGMDISKFFYGGYSLESAMKPWTHTNVARKIVNGLIVASLSTKTRTVSASIESTQAVNSGTAVFVMKALDYKYAQPASTDYNAFGRHWLVRSFSNLGVRRHYTLCQSLRTETYKELLGAIELFRAKKEVKFRPSVLPEASNGANIVFVAKNYKVKGGLSLLLHESDSEESFQVKGLMGKGLGLQKNGIHVAFTAGTGCLVFMDLVALLLRLNLGLVEPDSIPIFSKGSSFKFVLYVSFPTRADSIALQLLEGLLEVTKAKNLGNFELVVRISKESPKGRWDEAFIEKEVDKFISKRKLVAPLSKLYVCGPPAMNETFDRTLGRLIKAGTLRQNQVEVM